MDDTIQFLNQMYKNAHVGASAIDTVLPKTEDPKLRDELTREMDEYRQMAGQIGAQLEMRGEKLHQVSPLQEASMWMGIQMNTLMDKGTSHMAEMLIQGNTMGVVDITKGLNSLESADPAVRNLAGHYINLQRDNINRLKPYLSD